MLISKNSRLYGFFLSLPIFLICFFGREYRGLGIPTFLITMALAVSIFFAWARIRQLFSVGFLFFFALFSLYVILNVFWQRSYLYEFDFVNFLEDVYSVFIVVLFFGLGKYVFSLDGEGRKLLNLSILLGVALNVVVCVVYAGSQWGDTYFQRLWNPYLLFFIPFVTFVGSSRSNSLLAIVLLMVVGFFAISLQILLCAFVVLLIVLVPQKVFDLVAPKFSVLLILVVVVALQVSIFWVDPYLIAQIDHNAGVRAVFWHEALEYFISEPFGMGFGVSVVSGDMSLIGKSMFHGNSGGFEDLGVHSGLISFFYKFGFFSLLGFYFLARVCVNSVAVDFQKNIVLVFLVLMTLFVNDSFFTPHFSAAVGLVLGLLSGARGQSYQNTYPPSSCFQEATR